MSVGQRTVLIIEREEGVGNQLQALVQSLGYRVTTPSASVQEAVESLRNTRPDVVLLDSDLAGKGSGSGFAIGEVLRKSADVPIVYLIPHQREEALTQVLVAGADSYLGKPVRRAELRVSLEIAQYKFGVEQRLRHLNQVMRALRDISHLITHTHEARQLQQGICEILQRTRGYRFVWLGHPEGSRLKLITSAGEGRAFFDHIVANITPEQGRRLPGTRAFHSRQPVVCHDMLNDERYAPWREAVERAQFRSTLAVPLLLGDDVYGALSVYSDRVDVFDEEEVGLLLELARDIAFGLKAIAEVEERTKAEAELEHYRHHLEDLVHQRTAELSASEAKTRQILQSSADGLCGIDRDGAIVFINRAACDMLGYRDDEVVGRLAHPLFHHSRPDGTAYPEKECPSVTCLRTGQVVRVDNEVYWHSDGHAIPVMYSAHPLVQEGLIIGAVISFVDLTARHAADEAREQALEAAETLARVRKEFLANMSHEIRTPLNGVLGFAEIGYRHCQDSEKARDAFTKIRHSGQLLLGVINDILDFSKIEQGKLTIESIPVNLISVLHELRELMQGPAEAKGIALRIVKQPALPTICVTDPLRLRQVLANLLSNAVKFTECGSVTLSASLEREELVFEVADTGIGIHKEQMSRLFCPFEQADGSTTRKYGGTGLGLPIAKHLVELMGGHLGVASSPGAGARFEVRLPYQPAGAKAAPEIPAPSLCGHSAQQPLAGLSILVAEDDAINQCVLEENLRSAGAKVVIVGNGQDAYQTALRDGPNAFDIVLMDVQMPVMDGYEATRQILNVLPDLPIIGQTAHAYCEERDECFAAGMVAHIAKPSDPNDLVRIVLQHARRVPR